MLTGVRYQVGTQLVVDPSAPGATEAAFERFIRELVEAGVPEAMWAGRPAAGRIEVMLVVDATDAEHALATSVAALRAAARAMGRALPAVQFRSLAAQPLGNPDDWAERDD